MNPTKLQLRLVFDNGVLSKIQEQNGENRSWVLLKPHYQTICDVVSYILHSFDLQDSCPHGIILFRDGFVVPEFESISILKDNDLIGVKRKETRVLNASKAVQEATAYIEDGIVEKLPSLSGVKLLADEEFDKQIGGYQSESEKDEDEGVKIRLPVQNDPSGDLASKKRKSSSKLESANVLDEDKDDNIQASAMSDKTKKVSRSVLRRKKWRFRKRLESDEAKKNELCDRQQPVKDMTINTGPEKQMVAIIVEQSEEDTDAEGDLVPVAIQPSGKGQKWGQTSNTHSSSALDDRNQSTSSWQESGECNGQFNRSVYSDKLVPLVDLPKEDVWEKIIEAVSAKKARLMLEDKWNKKETGAKWPSFCHNEVQDDAEKVASKLSSEKPPTPGPGPEKQMVANIIELSDEDTDAEGDLVPVVIQLSGKVKDIEENQEANALDVNQTENITCEDHSGAKNVSDNQIVKEDVWEKIIEAVSAKKARLMQEDKWNKKETGAKWPSSCYNEVQDNVEKVASKLSSQKPPIPGLGMARLVNEFHTLSSKSKRDVWEEITEAASAKKARLMQEDNWNKKETGAKWPSSCYNEVQDDAEIVASKLSSQKPPTPGPANGKRDVWEEITEAASAKEAQLMLDDSWNKKETGAKWPSSSHNQVQDDAKKVASELSNQKPPTPGLANGEKDVWEEITEAAFAKKAQLMQKNIWKKKETGAKWPSSRYNEVQYDAKKVASELSNHTLPTPGLANGEKDVRKEITEAASAKKAQLMQENNWKKKETGAKRPSSSFNQVQNDAKKVASELSNHKPPPGLANGEKDVWEEIAEAASAKKAQLMQENNWNKKQTVAKWPSSRCNEVQDDAKKVASELKNQKPPTHANGEKDVSEELTKATSAKKAQLMQEDSWNEKETAAAMGLQELKKQCRWPRAVKEHRQPAKPSESAPSKRTRSRPRKIRA